MLLHPAATRPLLRLHALTAGYGRPVVGPLSLQLHPGERLGLWGPNGTGKSTLLRAIAHSARIFGGEIERAPGLTIALLDQQPLRLPSMPITGRELLRTLGTVTAAAPAALQPLLPRRIDRLSGGQYQLLWTWCALATGMTLTLLDEPTNNLDPASQELLVELLQDWDGSRALLVVSHEHRFLEAVCSRVLDLTQGDATSCSS